MSMKEATIQINDLSIGYHSKSDTKLVASHITTTIYSGELTCLLGANGVGKSTLLRTLSAFQPRLSGEIALLSRDIQDYSDKELSTIVGVVLTDKCDIRNMSVRELIGMGRSPYTGFWGRLGKEDKQIVEEAIAMVRIENLASRMVHTLSDGERQKVMIAKALAQQCPIILLDEPTAFLDVTSRIETMVLLHTLAVEQQKAILLSTHDLDLAIQLGDCLWLQEKSRPMACGTPEDLIMGGAFETFFSKEGIVFDPNTGKLNTAAPTKLIGVEGDFMTSYWVGNALIRNGFKPSSVSEDYISVYCNAPDSLRIQFPAEEGTRIVGSVAEMISIIIHKS